MNENVILKNYTTFRCGGPARFFDEPASVEEVARDIKFAKDNNIDFFVLGGGANCLISDKGFDGLVIRIGKELSDLKIDDKGDTAVVTAGAGLLLRSFGLKVAEAGFEGTEYACGIPGTLGGAVFMNAGAYGGEMKDIVKKVQYVDMNGEVIEVEGEDLGFGYRTSIFARMAREGQKFVITEVTAEVKKGNKEEVFARIEEYKEKRTNSQPLDVPSAGSTFKRPEGFFAGKLIDDTGLRGYSIEGSSAQVSPKHCGFVVNNGGNATAQEVFDLICDVSDKVYEKFQVRLEPEVRIIGEFEGYKPEILVSSFGFKYGVPMGYDLVFDVRVLKNPYWEPELKHLSGLDEPVKEYLASFKETDELIEHDIRSIEEKYQELTVGPMEVAVGCTGGHHRSVYCAETITARLKAKGYRAFVMHRDIAKESRDA